MSLKKISKNARLSAAIALTLFSASVSTVYALPTGGEVQSGDAKITAGENRVDIDQTSARVAIDWTSFNIANGETVNFNQPGADSIALNRVTGNDVSQIYGSLTANGKVFLLNPNGVLFGQGASVDVGGLVASTANVSNEFMTGFGASKGNFDISIDDANKAAIINQAVINAKIQEQGGLVVLHAANVENDGTITTDNGGTVQLAAGKTLKVNFDSAKINFTVDGGLSEANVLNAGTISAQNGLIAMTARGANEVLSSVVNTDGAKLEAKGLAVNEKGEIILDAGTGITAISGTVDVSGENRADGGNITVNSGNIYVESKAELNASGANGGNITMNTGEAIAEKDGKVSMTAGKVFVENGANIHAEATDKDGNNGTWTVNTKSTVDSWGITANQLAKAKQALADAKAEVEKLFETAQEKCNEAEAARVERDKAKAEVERLTQEIAKKTADNETKQKALQDANKALQEANKAVEDAKKAQSDAQAKLNEAQTKLNNANEAKTKAEKESNASAETLKKANGDYAEAQQNVKNAQKALDDASGALTTATDAQAKAQTAYDNAKSTAETAAKDLRTAESERDTVAINYNEAKSKADTKAQEAETAKQNAEKAQTAYDTVCGYVGVLDDCKNKTNGKFHIGYLKDCYIEDFKEAYKNLKEYAPDNLSEGYKQSIAQENGWENFWNGFLSWFNWDYERQHDAAKNTRTMFEEARNYEKGVSTAAQQAADSAKTTADGLESSLKQAEAKVTDKQTAKDSADAEVTKTGDALTSANTNKANAQTNYDNADSNLTNAKNNESLAKTLADNAQSAANKAAGELTAATEAANKAQGERDAAQTEKDKADTGVTNANTAQQGAQEVYNNADSALKASDEELTKLGGEKTASEKAVTDNEAARVAAYAESNENLKSGMEKLVEANKAFAKAANAKASQHNNSIISSPVISNTLTNTNVTIAADNETNTADIGLYNNITKKGDTATTLTLKADRNVILRGEIASDSDKELNIVTEAGSEQGNGDRYGATIVYNNIKTNGNLKITGNTYVGHYIRGNNSGINETGSDAHTVGGTIAAKDITFGGDVVLATGDTVNVIAKDNVTFNGTINSGNAYAYRMITTAQQEELQKTAALSGTNPNYWEYARSEAAKGNGYVAGESYLATITSDIEDSAVSAVRPNASAESYVGAKAGEWVTNEDGTKTREWKWVEGPEEGKTFYIQTVNKYGKPVSGETVDGGYSNFLEGEPSNTNWKQNVLATEYKNRWDDAFETGNNEGMYYAKYYIQEINVGESSLSIDAGKNIELNGQLGDKRSLNGITLNAETAHLGGAITAKGDLNIDAALTGKTISLTSTEGSINLTQSVTAETPKAEDVVTPQRILLRLRGGDSSEGDVVLEAAGDVNVADVNAQGKISVESGKNTTLNGVLKSDSNAIGAVQISAGEAFINNAGANAIQTAKDGTWQIYSATPENDVFGGLNSYNTAIWNAEGTVDNGGKNTYSFKYQPTLTVKANDATKTYGDVSEGNGVTVTNSLAGMENVEEFKNAFTDTLDAAKLLTGDVDVTSNGFAATATRTNGDYKNADGIVEAENLVAWGKTYENKKVTPYYEINVEGAENNTGYKVETEKGKLTVNQADLTINVGHVEADYGTSYGDIKKLFNAEAEGLKNDDSLDGVKYSTSAYEKDGRTKNVGSYYLDINQWPFVYNYNVKYHQGSVKINPKDVNLNYGGFEIVDSSIKVLEGTPSYESQLVNGDTTDNAPKISYGTTGLGDGLSYGVDYYVNGKKISNGDTVGNYRFNYDDSVVIRLDNPENKRVQTLDMMRMAEALKGNADFDVNLSNAAVEGVDRVAGLMDGELPSFKVEGQKVVPYGMFDISTSPDAVKVTAKASGDSGKGVAVIENMRKEDQYRELSKTLDTVDGAADFTLTYNGSRFQIYPDGKDAQALLAKGDSAGNVNVTAAALLSAFNEMGLSLEDMDAIYVHMDKDSAAH